MSRRQTHQPQHERFSRLPGQLALILWLTNAAVVLAIAYSLVSMQQMTGVIR
jgi:hypothetical protein